MESPRFIVIALAARPETGRMYANGAAKENHFTRLEKDCAGRPYRFY